MDDLISKRTAIDALEEIKHWIWEPDIPSPPIPDNVKDMLEYLDLWIKRIKEEPAVDAVRVVRCKERKYGEQDDYGWICTNIDGGIMGDENGNGFCCEGERREE